MRALAAALALFACGPPDWDGLLTSQGPGVAEQCGLVPGPGRFALHAVLTSGGQACVAGWTTYWELDETAQIITPERMADCPAAVAVSGCAVSLSLDCPSEQWRFALSLDSREASVVTTTPEQTCRYEARLARPPEP